MQPSDIYAEIEALRAARHAYYNSDVPLMSDAEYDRREDKLRTVYEGMRARFNERVAAGTIKNEPDLLTALYKFLTDVGAPPSGGAWPKVKHRVPMSSLNKAKVIEEMERWWRDCLAGTPAQAEGVIVSEKLDGGSLDLRYENGWLKRAVTRGDGETGEDITRNVLLMRAVPAHIEGESAGLTGHIRGEVLLQRSALKKHFPDKTNCRNTANGVASRHTDYEDCRHLTVLCYRLIPDEGPLPTKETEFMALEQAGFSTPMYRAEFSISGIEAVYQQYIDVTRDALDYDIDGLVVDVNDNAHAEALGEKNHRPKGAIAFKFPAEEQETTLRDIVWQVGNSGRITPVAHFDMVVLVDAEVRKATLHNVGTLDNLLRDIGQEVASKGDRIVVSRRGDVSPYVESFVEGFEIPDDEPEEDYVLLVPGECPSCGHKLVYDGEYLVCPDTLNCPAQVTGALKRWVEKVNILEWGGTTLDALYEKGLVKNIADLYALDRDTLAAVELSGRVIGSSADRMLATLHAPEKKDLPLHIFIGSLGIPLCSRSMVKTAVDAGFDTLDKLLQARPFEIEDIEGFGKTKAEALVEGLAARLELIQRLRDEAGITIKPPSTGALKGKNVCFTGVRDKPMEEAIEEQGGTIKSGVSKKLDILVAKNPTSNSGKAKKARSYGVEILGPDEMWDRLGGRP